MIELKTKIAVATAAGIAEAARILKDGGLVAFPTETVYGLGADATNGQAVAAIFAAKGRPLFNPLIVHVADLEEARRHVELSPRAQALAQKFWPGALTLVLPRRKNSPLSLLVSAGLDRWRCARRHTRRHRPAEGDGFCRPSANSRARSPPTWRRMSPRV